VSTIAVRTPADPQRTTAKGLWDRLRLLGRIILQRLNDDGTFQQAAALAYNTLFSLLPTFVLILLITSLVGGGGAQGSGHQVQNFFFQQFGLNEIKIVNETQGGTTDLATFVAARMEKVRDVVQSPQSGIIGFATLLWGAISLMMVIESTFSRIYRAKTVRSLPRRLVLYWAVLTLGPLGVAASLWLTHSFNTMAANVSAVQMILARASMFAGFLISFILLTFMYKLIPDTPVRFASAALGAFIGALLWEGGKYLFGLYVTHFVGYGKWYGTLGLVPLFMFWIYLTWNFVLLGLEVAYIHQHYAALARRLAFRAGTDSGLLDPRWILALGALLAQRFAQGRGVTADEVSDELPLPPDAAAGLLAALEQARVVHALANIEKCYSLSRPAENITVEELLAVARRLCPAPGEFPGPEPGTAPPAAATLAELQQIETTWARSKTLRDLMHAKT